MSWDQKRSTYRVKDKPQNKRPQVNAVIQLNSLSGKVGRDTAAEAGQTLFPGDPQTPVSGDMENSHTWQ